jgi:hypothetical protein
LLLNGGYLAASLKQDIYQAYISNNMIQWKLAMDRLNLQQNKDNATLLELINYQYGYIGWCMGSDQDDLAETYLDLADLNIAMLEKQKYNLSMLNAYKSAFYGYRIGLSPFQAPFIGPKSMDCAKKAVELDSSNPYGYIQLGNAEFYMPAVFGGSKQLALSYFQKAVTLMEQHPEAIADDWNYLSLLTMVAKSYEQLDKLTMAKLTYEKILKQEPAFLWVKNELYPQLLEKLKQAK